VASAETNIGKIKNIIDDGKQMNKTEVVLAEQELTQDLYDVTFMEFN